MRFLLCSAVLCFTTSCAVTIVAKSGRHEIVLASALAGKDQVVYTPKADDKPGLGPINTKLEADSSPLEMGIKGFVSIFK